MSEEETLTLDAWKNITERAKSLGATVDYTNGIFFVKGLPTISGTVSFGNLFELGTFLWGCEVGMKIKDKCPVDN